MATNTGAIRDLLNMWAQWVQDPSIDFPHGLARVKQRQALRSIRRWGPEDRLRDSGVIEDWAARGELAPQQPVPVEVELWYRAGEKRRRSAEGAVSSAFVEAGGEVLDTAVLPHIRYHGVLGSLPRGSIQQVLDGDLQGLALLVTEEVMFVRPESRVVGDLPGDVEDRPIPDLGHAQPAGDPRVALLDGLPLAGHQALTARLEIADPDGVEENYPAAARQHGTSMASLIIHGDLSKPGTPGNPAIRASCCCRTRTLRAGVRRSHRVDCSSTCCIEQSTTCSAGHPRFAGRLSRSSRCPSATSRDTSFAT